MYNISKLNYLKQNSNFSIRRSSCFVLKPSQPKRIKKGKISPVLDFHPFQNRLPLIGFCSALMYASIFGNVSAIIQRLYSGTARCLFSPTIVWINRWHIFRPFLSLFFSRISLITGIILRCSEWESSTNSIRWRRTFQLSPKISWIDIRLH